MGSLLVCLPLLVVAAPGVADELAQVRQLVDARRYAEAESLAVAAIGATGRDSLLAADLMAQYVRSQSLHGGFRDSLALAWAADVLGIRTRHLGERDSSVADAHHAIAYLLAPVGKLDSALVHATRSLEIREETLAPGDSLISESLRILGMVHRDKANYATSAEFFERAAGQREGAGLADSYMMAVILSEQGNVLRHTGRLDAAREVLLRALDICDRVLGPASLQRTAAMDYLAHLERERGHLAEAIELSLEAQRIARAHVADDHPQIVRLRRNMSPWLNEIGDAQGGRAILEKVLPSYVRQYGESHWRTFSARLGLGIALLACGDTVRARRELQAAEAGYLSLPGPPIPHLATTRLWIGEVQVAQGDHAGARATALAGREAARAAPVPRWLTLAELQLRIVESSAALGDTAGLEAERLELLRLADMRDVNSSNIPQNLRRGNARALRALGRTEEAWQEALAADRLAQERLRANVRMLSDRRALQLSLAWSPTLDLVFEMARQAPDARTQDAWDALVRQRGLVRDEVSRRRLPAESGGDSLVVAAHARWVDAQRAHARAIVGILAGPDSTLERDLERLAAEAERAERAYARALSGGARLLDPPSGSLAEVRRRLGADDVLIGFFETGARADTARLIALIARGDGTPLAWVDLGASAALERTITAWRERLATSPGAGARPGSVAERETRRAGALVRRALWDPLATHVDGVRRLYIVPDGPAAGLAWGALPAGDRGYLVEDGPVFAVLNAERDLLAPASREVDGALLAVGAPEFGAPAAASGGARLSADPCAAGFSALTTLPGTAAEVDAVAKRWRGPVTLLSGAEANEARFKQLAPGRAVLHLATHGFMMRDTCAGDASGLRGVGGVRPLAAPAKPSPAAVAQAPARPAISPWLGRRVWLALAGANRALDHTGDENEGVLTAEEVLTLDLSGADWVVLSACHSGVGESWSREGTLGMRRAFHLAGARTVIASEWAVEDEATREWMTALYDARATHAGAAAAMAEATRAVLALRRAAGRSTHPFYWAAFGASGD